MMKFTCLSQDNHYLDLFLLIYWSRKRQTTPVFLPEESHGQRSLAGYNPWGCKELDMTEHTHMHTEIFKKKEVQIFNDKCNHVYESVVSSIMRKPWMDFKQMWAFYVWDDKS